MKKLFSLLAAVLFAGSMMMAEESVVYELVPAAGENNQYAGNCDIVIGSVTWNLTGNSTMIPWRIGGKSITNVDRALYSKTAIADNVTKIEIQHGEANNITVNSFTVIVAADAEFSNVISTLTPTFEASATAIVERPEGDDWSGAFYKFVYNVTVSGTSNKFLQFVGAKFYADGEGGGEGGEGGEGIEYDEDADLAYTFYSYTIDDEYLSEYGDVYVEASDEDGYQVVLDIYLPEGATTLTPGVYPINDTYAASSVAAGDYYEGLYPSFAGIGDEEGLTNVWFIVSGAVAINNELNILVNAKNSLGHDIVLTIYANGEGSAVEATKAEIKAIKRIENGQLLIEKNGVRYNAQGAVVR